MEQNALIPEPNLFFGNNGVTIDPKIGLINFGPFGKFEKKDTKPLIIRAGVIGTKKSKLLLDSWLEKLRYRISGKNDENSNKRETDFPGISLEKSLRFDIHIEDSCVEYINQEDIDNLEKVKSRKERIVKALDIYEQKFSDLKETTHPKPDIVFIPLSEKLVELCKDSRLATNKIIYETRTFKKGKEYEDVPLFNFHHALKVVAYKNGNFMTQLIQPTTLNFSDIVQDHAKMAWNFAVAIYYKATGTPWKLSDIDSETCYIGLSFYQEISKQGKNMRASMAHVYLRTGESQIIRGKPFKWEGDGKQPQLSEELANNIITEVIDLYKRKKSKMPKRVVIHKTSPFTDDEIKGFDKATTGVEMADYVHINENNGILLFPSRSIYPPIRGTFIYKNNKFLLYTTGYVSSLDTYVGSTVPSPLFMEASRLDSSPEQIAKDIMALTKLDWNNADFNTRLPVTISVSRKVSGILAESKAQNVEMPSDYSYYM